jgi:hypothetical protein
MTAEILDITQIISWVIRVDRISHEDVTDDGPHTILPELIHQLIQMRGS